MELFVTEMEKTRRKQVERERGIGNKIIDIFSL